MNLASVVITVGCFSVGATMWGQCHQAGANCAGAQVAVHSHAHHTNGVTAGVQANQPWAPAPNDSNDLPGMAKFNRGVGIAAVTIGGSKILTGVGGSARSAANFGRMKSLNYYGGLTSKIPIIGSAVGKVPVVPTTLGQMPLVGGVVRDIPVVGQAIAGPPNPILVGAVAVDTYILPKVSECGYTESSEWTQTDFNSPPRLRHYKNYLAPLPYTHPPVYAPATLNTGQPDVLPDVASEGPTVAVIQ